MNKYQEAINELYSQRSQKYKVYQKHKDWNKEIKSYDKVDDCLRTLQELVDKTTPMKPIVGKLCAYYLRCPNCNEFAEEVDGVRRYKYCPDCGQKLDWSEVNE